MPGVSFILSEQQLQDRTVGPERLVVGQPRPSLKNINLTNRDKRTKKEDENVPVFELGMGRQIPTTVLLRQGR